MREGGLRLDQLRPLLVQAASQVADQHTALQGEVLRDHGAMALRREGTKLLQQPRHDVGDLLHHQVGVEVRIENQRAIGRHLLTQGNQVKQRLLVAFQRIRQRHLAQLGRTQAIALAEERLEVLPRLIADQPTAQRLGRLLQRFVKPRIARLQQPLGGFLGTFPARQQRALGNQLLLHARHTLERLRTFQFVIDRLQP